MLNDLIETIGIGIEKLIFVVVGVIAISAILIHIL